MMEFDIGAPVFMTIMDFVHVIRWWCAVNAVDTIMHTSYLIKEYF